MLALLLVYEQTPNMAADLWTIDRHLIWPVISFDARPVACNSQQVSNLWMIDGAQKWCFCHFIQFFSLNRLFLNISACFSQFLYRQSQCKWEIKNFNELNTAAFRGHKVAIFCLFLRKTCVKCLYSVLLLLNLNVDHVMLYDVEPLCLWCSYNSSADLFLQ